MAYLVFCVELPCFLIVSVGSTGILSSSLLSSVSVFMFIQYTKTPFSSLVFPTPIWLLCSCSNISDCSATSMITLHCNSTDHCQFFPKCPIWTCLVLHDLYWKAILTLHLLWSPVSGHHLAWLSVDLLLLGMLVFQLCSSESLCPYLQFHHIHFLCGFVWTVSLLWVGQDEVFVLHLFCIEWFLVGSSPVGQFVPFPTCYRPVTMPTTAASVQGVGISFHHKTSCMHFLSVPLLFHVNLCMSC